MVEQGAPSVFPAAVQRQIHPMPTHYCPLRVERTSFVVDLNRTHRRGSMDCRRVDHHRRQIIIVDLQRPYALSLFLAEFRIVRMMWEWDRLLLEHDPKFTALPFGEA